MKVYKGQQAEYESWMRVVFDDGRHVHVKVTGLDAGKVDRLSGYIEYCLKEDWINDPETGVI